MLPMQHPIRVARPMVMMTTKMDQADTGFGVDQQTWKDIDLFDRGGKGPVFNLFSKAKTAGGEEALERMLRQPSNQRNLLEGRRDTIRWFRDMNVDLPIGREQLNKIERYLSSGGVLFPIGWPKALIYSVRKQLKRASSSPDIVPGIRTTVSLLRQFFNLRAAWLAEDCPEALAADLAELPDLVSESRVRALLLGPGKHLGLMDLARCDHYFRGAGKPVLRRLLGLLYDWDAYQGVTSVMQHCDLTFPEYDDSPEPGIEVRGLFHPLLNNAVPNDYAIGQEANLCFITGATMAGKSTFLKSFGLAVYLAHVGFPVPARFFRTSVFNGLIATVNLADSIAQGYSHFYAEVQRVKHIVHQVRLKERVVVIFDELFRGAHLRDASEAALQVIDALAGTEGSLFLISTHIAEIADGLKGNPNIRFACFESTMEGGVPWYSYTLKEGVCNERAGMLILRNEGILEMLEAMQMRGKCSNF